ncbi:3,4-dihydroxy-2-butanone-4-phosphate synthase [Mycolicibacterium conceptionense]|uniref:3,4-dihydroxy-2-butanone-4-phosphate synthase n=1 Tax=Mycolicibacterium conceptionense TaxID=451644 RepID=UPI00096F4F75|nr:3,4-dihydroxy-2-butanone-4-phosphate synthase [Mycolicibacterium conceptionense]OMB80554.1 hypothetical protein A5743_10840 [Mycolicibacterium conceptionense]
MTATNVVTHAGAALSGGYAVANEAFSSGQLVVVSDDRECALAMSAAAATTHAVAEMIRFGSGLVFVALTRGRLDQLDIPQMPTDSTGRRGNFHVAVDSAAGISTGISAVDRCQTMRALADPGTVRDDFVRPGHLIPVAADIVPARSPGIAELALTLASTADPVLPAAAFCALTSEVDPCRVADPDEGQRFAQQHGYAFVGRQCVLTAYYSSGSSITW